MQGGAPSPLHIFIIIPGKLNSGKKIKGNNPKLTQSEISLRVS